MIEERPCRNVKPCTQVTSLRKQANHHQTKPTLMIKTQFQKEITISGTQSAGSATNNKKDVLKIQCWLNLFAQQNPGSGTSTGIDGDFGQATAMAVTNYQKAKKLDQTGKVDATVFASLCEPMTTAFYHHANGEKPARTNCECRQHSHGQQAF